jgi:DNA-directed RNA polymerase specialized sigma24 family protein
MKEGRRGSKLVTKRSGDTSDCGRHRCLATILPLTSELPLMSRLRINLFDAAEVAAKLDITVESVQSRLHRARNILRTTIDRLD